MNLTLIDKQTEKSVIGSCFLGGFPTLYEVAEILEVEDFYGEQHREIYETLLAMEKKKQPITDIIVVNKALHDKYSLVELIDIMSAVTTYTNARYYAEIIKSKSLARKKYQQCQETMKNLLEGNEPREVISKSMQDDMAILNSQKKADVVHAKDTYYQFIDEINERAKNGGIVGFETGFKTIDAKLRGMRKGGMYLLAARPKMGKTTLALNVASHLAIKKGVPVYFKSLEMTTPQIHEKLANDLADIENWKLSNAAALSDFELKKIANVGQMIYDSKFYIDERSGRASSFATSLRRWNIENQNGIAIVDYIQRFAPEKGTKGEYDQVSEMSNIICNTAKELNIPIFALSQLSREVEKRNDKTPLLSDLRGSGALEQDATAVMMLYRDDYYYPSKYPKNNDPSVVDVYIHANRFGPTGQGELLFYKSKSKFIKK